ncbi:MAG: hypothetical protein NC548_48115 [Lachnospiraceae bacterium]|nr:hypothetical protein [Lachnospiraceae bacterium]
MAKYLPVAVLPSMTLGKANLLQSLAKFRPTLTINLKDFSFNIIIALRVHLKFDKFQEVGKWKI